MEHSVRRDPAVIGLANRINGIRWEMYLQRQANREGAVLVQMPLGCKRVGKRKLVQIKTPFDFCLVKNGVAIFIDCKFFQDKKSIAYSDMTPHQVESLFELEKYGKATSGYLIYFESIDLVCFAKSSDLKAVKRRDSLRIEKMTQLGALETFKLAPLFSKGEIKNEQAPRDPSQV